MTESITKPYNASSIKVLSDKEAQFKFDWVGISALAKRHKVTEDFITKGFEVSRRMGISTDYFIAYYLDKSCLEVDTGFSMAYRDYLLELRDKSSVLGDSRKAEPSYWRTKSYYRLRGTQKLRSVSKSTTYSHLEGAYD